MLEKYPLIFCRLPLILELTFTLLEWIQMETQQMAVSDGKNALHHRFWIRKFRNCQLKRLIFDVGKPGIGLTSKF
jgi:hypothetical protein